MKKDIKRLEKALSSSKVISKDASKNIVLLPYALILDDLVVPLCRERNVYDGLRKSNKTEDEVRQFLLDRSGLYQQGEDGSPSMAGMVVAGHRGFMKDFFQVPIYGNTFQKPHDYVSINPFEEIGSLGHDEKRPPHGDRIELNQSIRSKMSETKPHGLVVLSPTDNIGAILSGKLEYNFNDKHWIQ